MMNAITGERLQDLFVSEPWHNLFTTLSDSLGFSLSVYSQTGRLIFAPLIEHSQCGSFLATSPGLESQCKTSCHPRIMNVLATGKPDVYKCLAKIVCFALSVEYLGEKAVILGRGSFSSYEDFREYMNLAAARGVDAIAVRAPLTFTSQEQAWKACRFIDDTVNRSLQNMQETAALRKKFDSLMSVFSLWGSATVEQPEMRYQDMLYNLSTLLDIDHITILALDREAGRYTGLYGISKSGAPTEAITIDENDTVVKELLSGKPFIRTATQVAGPASKAPAGRESRFFFPILVNKTLGGILCITNQILLDRDRQIIAGFCKQTALFIENFHLHQDLYKKFNRFALMSELNRAITPIQNYDTLLQMILDKSAELLKAEQGSLMMLDQKTDALLLEAKKGIIQGVSGKICIPRGEGIAGKVAERGEPYLVKDLEDDPRIKQKNRNHYRTRSFVSVPLKIADRVIGVLNLSDKTTGEVFDEEDLKLIQSIATHAAVVVERNEFYAKSEELKKLTITDTLTGLLNRRYLQERLKDELARSERHIHPMSLLMLDLDGFKSCNDSEGHLVGDKILQEVAETLLKTVRSMDIVARFGGDEFMVILPETSEPVAIEIGERLRNSVSTGTAWTRKAGGKPEPCILTASIGIVCYPEHGDTAELLLENVDKALYRAKNKGKNRIEVFS
ncbi:MAG: diguanylate cyclase [Nitrospirae bacterium]|nr:diguanylate cyclase [Nitrospirota bacterium]